VAPRCGSHGGTFWLKSDAVRGKFEERLLPWIIIIIIIIIHKTIFIVLIASSAMCVTQRAGVQPRPQPRPALIDVVL